VNIERDVLDRLTQLAIRFYVTGSWALSVYAEPRMTRDLDLVVDLDAVTYERMVRPEFERDYLVNDPIDVGGRWIGGLVHRVEIVRIDLMFGRQDGWARSAFERSAIVDHPGLGPTPMISAEDLILAKLDWSDGGRSELQMRDCRSIIRLATDLDWDYLQRYAPILGVDRLLGYGLKYSDGFGFTHLRVLGKRAATSAVRS